MPYQIASAFVGITAFAVHGSEAKDVVSNTALSQIGGAPTLASDGDGAYIQCSGTTGLRLPATIAKMQNTTGHTWVFAFKRGAPSAIQALFGVGDPSAAYERIMLDCDYTETYAAGRIAIRARNAANTTTNHAQTANTVLSNDTYTRLVIQRLRGQATFKIFLNGAEISWSDVFPGDNTSTGNYTNIPGILELNNGGTSLYRGAAKLYFAARIDTDATDGASLSSNPFQIVEATGGGGTASGVTLTATASLIPGSASGSGSATANGVTLTATGSLIAGSASGVINGVLTFQAAGLEFGGRTGLGIDTFALDAGVSYRYSVHADGLTLGAAILTSAAISLDSAGKLPNLVSNLLTPGSTYRIFAIRQTDGEAATFRLTAS